MALRFETPVEADRVRAALARLVDRYEILRTTYHHLAGASLPLQVIADRGRGFDERPLVEGVRDAEGSLDWLCESAIGWDLGQARSLRAALSPEGGLAFLVPSMAADAATIDLLADELVRSLAGGAEEEPDPLQYADIAEWRGAQLEEQSTLSGRASWRRRNPMALPALRLPGESMTETRPFQPRWVSRVLEPGQAAALAGVMDGASVGDVVLAAWLALLGRLTSSPEIVFALAADGRNDELAAAVGLVEQNIPVRIGVNGSLPFRRLVAEARAAVSDTLARQDTFSWDDLEVAPGRRPAPAVAFEDRCHPRRIRHGAISAEIVARAAWLEPFVARLACVREDVRLRLDLHYDQSALQRDDAVRLLDRLAVVLQCAAERPEASVDDLDVLPAAEREQVTVAFNRTEAPAPEVHRVDDWIRQQVESRPDAVAVRCGDQSLSYRQFADRARRVATILRDVGCTAGTIVGVCSDRSVELPVALMAVLEAGCAYVPLDPAYPADRLAYMLADSGARVVLAPSRLAGRLPAFGGHVVTLDSEAVLTDRPAGGPAPAAPGDLAYVIYTSGSTGQPKGVQVTHANLVHSTHARFVYYPEPVQSYLLLSSFAFDSSVAGIFWTLGQGGTLVLPAEGAERDPLEVMGLVRRHRISHMLCLPSLYELVLAEASGTGLDSLRVVIVAGEACPRGLLARHHLAAPRATLYNEYGPTEGTVWCTVYRCPPEAAPGPIPIGRPIPHARVYVLDGRGRPVPAGVAGELHVGGPGVARGYWNRPDLDEGRFVPDRFGKPGERLYRTGDLARHLPTGDIEFLGRLDQQVKIRGYRIELEEIEAVLRQLPAVRDVVVDARAADATPDSARRLVAYVVPRPGEGVRTSALREFVRERLPDYMVPAAFVTLDVLPLGPNGKVDRRALPDADPTRPELGTRLVAPRNPLEALLVGIWRELLQVRELGVHDDFFELGGHSILATRVVSRTREVLDVPFSLRTLFERPTVAAMAEALTKDAAQAPRVLRTAELLLSVSEMTDEQVEARLKGEGSSARA